MVLEKDRINMYLQRILDSINKIFLYTKDINIANLDKHKKDLDACLMQLINIWETMNKISKVDNKFYLQNIDLKKIINFRNFVVHNYFWVNITIIKDIIKIHLPILKKEIENKLKWQK